MGKIESTYINPVKLKVTKRELALERANVLGKKIEFPVLTSTMNEIEAPLRIVTKISLDTPVKGNKYTNNEVKHVEVLTVFNWHREGIETNTPKMMEKQYYGQTIVLDENNDPVPQFESLHRFYNKEARDVVEGHLVICRAIESKY